MSSEERNKKYNAKYKDKKAQYYQLHKDKLKELRKIRYQNNKEQHKKDVRKWQENNPARYKEINAAGKVRARGCSYKKNYWPHLTWEEALIEYDRLFSEQNGKCKICEVHQTEFKQRLSVDHDHLTKKVRGLLCSVCNRFLIASIDTRAKAKKVHVSLEKMLYNIVEYYKYKTET